MTRSLAAVVGLIAAAACGRYGYDPLADGEAAFDAGGPGGADAAALGCVAELALSTLTSCARLDDGTVRCFGWDRHGELGDGAPFDHSTTPVVVQGLDDVVGLEGGANGFCAVDRDGGAWCWGRNVAGGNGDGTLVDQPTPVPVQGLADVAAIARGGGHACALRTDGTVWCWGANQFGEAAGDGTTTARPAPTQVPIGPATRIALTYDGSCAVLADDSGVACWGLSPDGADLVPVVTPVTGVTALAAHSHSIYALRDDGTVWAWGENGFGQLGDGTTTTRIEPAPVAGLVDAISIAGGNHHACALLADERVWCWGRNENHAQLGSPGSPDAHLPIQVEVPPATAVAAGQEHSCMLAVDGGVRCWGFNAVGQLGASPHQDASAPVVAAGPTCEDG